ncbi:MAG TPA: DUF4290 domain-containing protein [Bacteroidetes bacterium]|nr:DUF4290 domain-containing protein [Bacteroidota bacterium]
MDYNTSRKKMVLPEYGRNIQEMVDYACTIEDREERNRAARTIIQIMGQVNPGLRDQGDVRHKLWDHLFIMSDFKLDIDSPYPIPPREKFYQKPDPVEYNTHNIKYMHYGRITEQLIEAAIAMEEGQEKQALVTMIANHMKKSYLTWNRNQVTDEIIFKDLETLSGGKLKVSENTRLSEPREIFPVKGSRKKRGQQRKGSHS